MHENRGNGRFDNRKKIGSKQKKHDKPQDILNPFKFKGKSFKYFTIVLKEGAFTIYWNAFFMFLTAPPW